jgi:hypothetical protein
MKLENYVNGTETRGWVVKEYGDMVDNFLMIIQQLPKPPMATAADAASKKAKGFSEIIMLSSFEFTSVNEDMLSCCPGSDYCL